MEKFDLNLALAHPNWVGYKNGKLKEWKHFPEMNRIVSFNDRGEVFLHNSGNGMAPSKSDFDLILNVPEIIETFYIVRYPSGLKQLRLTEKMAKEEVKENVGAIYEKFEMKINRKK